MTLARHRFDADSVRDAVRGDRFLDLVAELGGRFRRRRGARHLRMPCFLHGGRDANLVVTPETGLWHCMSTCGGGDVFELVERARGLAFADALAWLGEWARTAPAQRAPVAPAQRRAPAPDVGPLMSELWSLVESAPLGAAAVSWLRDERGIDPDAAYALGCRDWSTRRGEIARLIRDARAELLEAAGFGREAGWRPLLSVLPREPDPAWAGLAIPAWPIDSEHPTRWRWRLYRAPAGEAKSRSPIGGDADLLGLGRPAPLQGASVAVARPGAPGVDTLLLVEGEPDWLAATEAVDGRALVVGVCGSPTCWRDTWPGFGDLGDLGVRRVVVCVHRGTRLAPCTACGRQIAADCERCRFCATKNDSGRSDGLGHGERFAVDVAAHAAAAGLACRRRLPAETYDLNDRHRDGKLRAWLGEVLA